MLLTRDNFEEVLKSSLHKPLFCLFYVDDLEECAQAKTALTTAISDSNEYVSLALCNVEDPVVQQFAFQLQVPSMPTLVVIDQGQPVSILEGNDIVTNLSQLLEQFMPSEAENLMREALQAEAAGAVKEACTKAGQAYGMDESNLKFKHIYVRLLIASKNTAKARELLDNAGREEKSSPDYQQLLSALELAEQAQNSPELKELETKFNADPSDENAVAYAIALSSAGKNEDALNILLAKLKEDLNKEDVKKTFLDILSTMDGDKLQSVYRRKLYTLMY